MHVLLILTQKTIATSWGTCDRLGILDRLWSARYSLVINVRILRAIRHGLQHLQHLIKLIKFRLLRQVLLLKVLLFTLQILVEELLTLQVAF